MSKIETLKVLVTGATSGIGRGLALELLKNGASVAFCGRSEEKLNELKKELSQMQIPEKQYICSAFDSTNKSKILSFVSYAINGMGGLDILVNCAGANTAKGNVIDINPEDLEYMLKVNLVGPFVFMQEAGKYMISNKKGLIVNIQSTVCLFSNEGIGSYTASKSGFDALTSVFRKEARKHNVRVSSIYPGGVDTPFRTNARPDYLSVNDVVKSIIHVITADGHIGLDEIVLRPFVEMNFK